MSSAYEIINAELGRCGGGKNFVTENGSRFVFLLNELQRLRYFHKVYTGLEKSELSFVCNILGFPLPVTYKNFLLQCSGASLFDQTTHIFGFNKDISRTLDLDEQRPLFIAQSFNDFRSDYPWHFSRLWRPIGSIVLSSRIWIALNEGGRVCLLKEKSRRDFASLDEAMAHVVSILAVSLGCEPVSTDGRPDVEETLFHSLP